MLLFCLNKVVVLMGLKLYIAILFAVFVNVR